MRKIRLWHVPGLCVTVCLGIFLLRFLWLEVPMREPRKEPGRDCRAYYLLNMDGMKGLGHAALLLVDEKGEGRLFSYNGMEYNLFWCLLGKKGLGKMKEFSLDASAVEGRLLTGDLPSEEYEECRNFDRALWRYLSGEEYEKILQGTEAYLEPPGADTPLYQIYSHNCDTAARELIGLADRDMDRYNRGRTRLTPGGNYKRMCRELGSAWGVTFLGEDTLCERAINAAIF